MAQRLFLYIDASCLKGLEIVSKISESNHRQNYIVKSNSDPKINLLLRDRKSVV